MPWIPYLVRIRADKGFFVNRVIKQIAILFIRKFSKGKR